MLIDSEKTRAEVFRRHEAGYWFIASEADTIGDGIELASIGLTLALNDVYAETEGVLG